MGLITGFTLSASALCEARGGTWDAAHRACVTKEEAQAAAVKAWEAYIPQFQRTLSDETLLHMDNISSATVPQIEVRIFDHFKWVRDKYANPAGRYDEAVQIYDAGVRNLRLAMQAVRDSAEAGVTDPQVCNLLKGWDWRDGSCVNRASVAAAQAQREIEVQERQAEIEGRQADIREKEIVIERERIVAEGGSGGGLNLKKIAAPALGLLALLALLKMRGKKS